MLRMIFNKRNKKVDKETKRNEIKTCIYDYISVNMNTTIEEDEDFKNKIDHMLKEYQEILGR